MIVGFWTRRKAVQWELNRLTTEVSILKEKLRSARSSEAVANERVSRQSDYLQKMATTLAQHNLPMPDEVRARYVRTNLNPQPLRAAPLRPSEFRKEQKSRGSDFSDTSSHTALAMMYALQAGQSLPADDLAKVSSPDPTLGGGGGNFGGAGASGDWEASPQPPPPPPPPAPEPSPAPSYDGGSSYSSSDSGSSSSDSGSSGSSSD